MFINNYQAKDKKVSSNKKVHRRVITEVEEINPPKNESRKNDKVYSKPKFIDVYSKYIPK